MDIDFESRRNRMVEHQLKRRGIKSDAVLAAMGKVRREAFVPRVMRPLAYNNAPLGIGTGQTISQPLMVATMTEALKLQPDHRVLEVGTGSGYGAAVLGEIAMTVFTLERHPRLAKRARKALAGQGYDNVHVIVGDGSLGLESEAPFDAIIVTAGAPAVPENLKRQLAIGARLVVPVGDRQTVQELLRITRTGKDAYSQDALCGVRFVPLIGAGGWPANGQ